MRRVSFINLFDFRRSFGRKIIFLFGFLAFGLGSVVEAQDYTVRNTDYDGDGLGDLISWDSTSAGFLVRQSSNLSLRNVSLGERGSQGLLYDFDGDGQAELASFNPATAAWAFEDSQTEFGEIGSVAVPGRYESSDCTNLATYNKQSATWSIQSCDGSSERSLEIGGINFIPVAEDFDCDGLTDPAVFNRLTSRWTVVDSSTGVERSFFYGLPGDIPFGLRFSRSDCADVAVYRQAGNYLLISNGNRIAGDLLEVESIFQWGLTGDQFPLIDVDGDGFHDLSVHRSLDQTAYITASEAGLFFTVPFPSIFENRYFQSLPSIELGAFSGAGDYDRDGRSDLVFADVNRGANQTSLLVNSPENLQAFQFTLPSAADAIVPADYDGDGVTDVAAVLVEADASLIWTTRLADGSVEQVSFGQNGDQPIAGDYDCDGRADKAVVRQEGFFKIWRFLLANGQETGEVLFGIEGDQLHVADVTGDSCDELIISRIANGGIDWWFMDVREGEPQYIQWGLAGDELLSPADVNGDGRDDFLVSRVGPTNRTIFALLGPGVSTVYNFLETGGQIMTGNFSGVNHAEFAALTPETGTLAILRGHAVYDFKLLAVSGDFFITPSFNVFSLAASNPTGDETGDPGSNGGGLSAGIDCSVERDFFDGGGGDLWKPVSESTGDPVILLPAEYWETTESIDVFGSQGEFIVNGTRRTCCPNDNRAHFDVPVSANELAPSRPITVRFNLRDGTRECRIVQDPRDRND